MGVSLRYIEIRAKLHQSSFYSPLSDSHPRPSGYPKLRVSIFACGLHFPIPGHFFLSFAALDFTLSGITPRPTPVAVSMCQAGILWNSPTACPILFNVIYRSIIHFHNPRPTDGTGRVRLK